MIKKDKYLDSSLPTGLNAGDTIEYTFTVTNTGNTTVTGITVTDALLGVTNLAITPSTLAPNATGTLILTYVITQADINAGKVTNTATTNGTSPTGPISDISDSTDPTLPGASDPTVTILPQSPQMTLVKTASIGGIGTVGDIITYTFTVTNIGNTLINNISISDPLISSNNIVINPSSLAPGATGTATATYTITQADADKGLVENTATANGQTLNGTKVTAISDDGIATNGNNNPTISPINSCQIVFFNAITPSGDDDLNNYFKIQGIECYPDNNVEIYNRWGVLVYEMSGYDNVNNLFRGESNGRVTIKQTEELPNGTYFYVLKYSNKGIDQEAKAGYLYINR